MNHCPENYQLIKSEHIAELDGQASLLFHKKTGARVVLIENKDENKAFSISFRTPIDNSTGKPHILEHSVLCGSDRYPVKDPFMELAKSSLQTFLNAMTFSDKTMYPVASCNAKDMNNLMSVYLDAVFHPLIYKNKNIFLQEGWHYELEDPEAELGVNGVVYNEMKGAFSDPEEVLFRYVQSTLYPDITYFFESGGDPDCIPDLSWEEFLDFHRKYYHPSNSYIFLYGDMDMEERLAYIDQEYLSHYDRTVPDSEIGLQAPFDSVHRRVVEYALPEEEPKENKDWICKAWCLDHSMDNTESIAWSVLERVLTGVEGAPLRQALLDAGLGEDVSGGFRGEIRQPYFYIASKNIARDDADRFVSVVMDTLNRIVSEGIGEKALRAAINSMEFQSREADFGGMSKGLIYAINCMDTWLYNDEDPFSRLRYEKEFAELKERVNTGYFEELLKKALIANTHSAEVELRASAGLQAKADEALKQRLADRKSAMTREELEALVREGKELLAYQEAEDSQEALATVPKLERSDLSTSFKGFSAVREEVNHIPLLHHEIFTSGICYVTLSYDVSTVPVEQLHDLSLLRRLIGSMDTENRSYQDLANEIMLVSGGIGTNLSVMDTVNGKDDFLTTFDFNIKTVRSNLAAALDLAIEMRDRTDYSDSKRLGELIRQLTSRCEQGIIGNADNAAASRALSYFSRSSWYTEQQNGIDFLRWLKGLSLKEEDLRKLSGRLIKLAAQIFDDSRLTVSITEDVEGYKLVKAAVSDRFSAEQHCNPAVVAVPQPEVKNEGIILPGQVNYAALAGDFTKAGFAYNGAFNVLRSILGNTYLWTELRVKGGAYGCMSRFRRSGKCYLVSYRDPHIRESYEVYQRAADFLRAFDPTEREMTDYIIGVIGSFDRPLTPSMWGAASFSAALGGITNEMIKKEREEILSATPEMIRRFGDMLEALAAQNYICTLGCEAELDNSRDLFAKVENLS